MCYFHNKLLSLRCSPTTCFKTMYIMIGRALMMYNYIIIIDSYTGNNLNNYNTLLQIVDPIDRIVLFDSTNFRGPNVTLFCNAPYLGAADNKASSAIVLGK